jgi:hypothetical protein
MALVKCKECGKDVSEKAESCPNCGAPVEVKPKSFRLSKSEKKGGCLSSIIKLFGLGLLCMFIYVTFIADSGDKIGGIVSSDFTIKVSGTAGLNFSGTYMVTAPTGKSVSKSVDGVVPAQYKITGSIVSLSFQKKAESGILKVEIIRGGRVVAETQTSAAYGVASVATN